MKKNILAVIFVLILSVETSAAGEIQEAAGGWKIIESRFTTIHVDKDLDCGVLGGRLDVSFAMYDPVEKNLFYERGLTESEILANKIDIIARKAMRVLDMKPEDFHVNIRIYGNEEKLWKTYDKLFDDGKRFKAFYVHKYATVYIPYENLGESILAHEIGHAVIDSYFGVLPPEKIRELLACYVDVHLKD